MGRNVAYIMSRFPHLTETFILREMNEVERLGWQVSLYPLMIQQQETVHSEVKPWISRIHRLPFISIDLLLENGLTMVRRPFLYFSLLARVLWGNRTSINFILRAIALFPKAIYAARLMQKEGIKHIHAHYATHPTLVAWLIHRLTGISYSLTVHAHDIFVRTAMLPTKLQDASFVAAISEYNRKHLEKSVAPWVKEKTHIVHCGIIPDNYIQRSEGAREDKQRFEIITIGSLQPYKGFHHLIYACELLRDRGIPMRCCIIGGGKERSRLEKQIRASRLESIVELLGPLPQEEVAKLLPTAQCYVQPSVVTASGKMEGIPVSLMEAAACTLTVVASSLSGIPELVRPGETGYLVPPADPAALADTLAEIYHNPKEAERRAKEGRALVLREFELSGNVKRLVALFEQVIKDQSIALEIAAKSY